MYLDDNDARNDVEKGAVEATVWLDPNVQTPSTPVTGMFHQLVEGENADFVLFNDRNLSLPQLVLNTPISRNHALAVFYREIVGLNTANPETVTVGSFAAASGDTARLKMLRPAEEDWGVNDLTLSVWARCAGWK